MRTPIISAALLALTASIAHAEIVAVTTAHRQIYKYQSTALGGPISVAQTHTAPGNTEITIWAIDYRPSNNDLYGCTTTNLYKINDTTGECTLVGPFGTPITSVGDIDFSPDSDEIRMTAVIGGSVRNLRVNPNTGAIIATETPFTRTGQPPSMAYLAYSTAGGVTRLFGHYGIVDALPSDRWKLGEIGSAAGGEPSFNAGVTTDIGTINVNSFGASSTFGFDISSATGTAYTTLSLGVGPGFQSQLHTVNLTTGSLTSLGRFIGLQPAVLSIAVVPPVEPCHGDANDSGNVDGADLSILLSQFGNSGQPGVAPDFNNDGLINSADLSVLLANFGSSC